MRFGIFYEHQLPKPWNDGDEEKLLNDAIDQVVLADRLGIDEPVRRYRYAVRICPEPEHWGGLSGCSYTEGVSWGKFVPESEGGKHVEVHADATIAWPIVVRALIERFASDT